MKVRHLVMLARELHILYKFSKMTENNFVIKLQDLQVNQEAYLNPSLMETVYLVTKFEDTDLE